ncbi:MAG: hypothetical protein KatS3mg105_3106 [Gemmatales bacterium]|nr:MAG: hypothetical protein KatS3mg105_3106 [Gemmatales bacterium]
MFPNQPAPLGEWLKVDRVKLRIIGVVGEKGRSPTGADQDNQVFVPLSTMQHKIMGHKAISLILASARSDDVLDQARAEIIQALRQERRLKPDEAADFDVSSVRELAEVAHVVTTTMHVLTAIIAAISLVVGGIGIMNIMIVSVTERTREIGVRMAIGASSFDVLIQFLMEAVVLSLAGGVIGTTVGILGALGLSHLGNWPLVVEPWAVVMSFFVSAGVGVFFGFYPALCAARMNPIDAIRHE